MEQKRNTQTSKFMGNKPNTIGNVTVYLGFLFKKNKHSSKMTATVNSKFGKM